MIPGTEIGALLNARLVDQLGGAVAGVFDTKLDDGYVLTDPVVIVQSIDDIPEIAIDGAIVMQTARWQISIRSTDLLAARGVKLLVVQALHGYSDGAIIRCDYEAAHGEIFEPDVIPFEYHIPVDFMILH
jgi:hypothetical protein